MFHGGLWIMGRLTVGDRAVRMDKGARCAGNLVWRCVCCLYYQLLTNLEREGVGFCFGINQSTQHGIFLSAGYLSGFLCYFVVVGYLFSMLKSVGFPFLLILCMQSPRHHLEQRWIGLDPTIC